MNVCKETACVLSNLCPMDCATLQEMECVKDGMRAAVITRVGTIVRDNDNTRVSAVTIVSPGFKNSNTNPASTTH